MYLSQDQLQLISDYQPTERFECSLMRAAVAIILRDGQDGTEFLMMQRAKHERDPWSGQMSFPGGKIEKSDATPKDAAVRETYEEVGIELGDQDYIGQLDDVYGLKVDNQYSVHVACFVFKPRQVVVPIGNHEVEDLVWLPLVWLQRTQNAHDYVHPHSGRQGKPELVMPAVMIDANKEQILWGLSLRIVAILHELLSLDLPVLDRYQQEELKGIEKQNMSSKELDSITQRLVDRELL